MRSRTSLLDSRVRSRCRLTDLELIGKRAQSACRRERVVRCQSTFAELEHLQPSRREAMQGRERRANDGRNTCGWVEEVQLPVQIKRSIIRSNRVPNVAHDAD